MKFIVWPLSYILAWGFGYLLYRIGGLWLLLGALFLYLAIELRHRFKHGHYMDGSAWDGYIPLLVQKLLAKRRRRRSASGAPGSGRDGKASRHERRVDRFLDEP